MHYGIQGMKWGIRRWQNTDGSLTPEGREHYGLKKNSDGSLTIPKGHAFYRTTADKADKSGRTKYVSATDVDRAHYTGDYADWIAYQQTGKVGSQPYEVQYTNDRDLRVADRETLIKEVGDYMSDPKNVKEFAKTFAKHCLYLDYQDVGGQYDPEEYKMFYKDYVNTFMRGYGSWTPETIFQEVSATYGQDSKLREKMASRLIDKGFDAMMDQASIGGLNDHDVQGVAPLIVFNPDKNLRRTSTGKLSSQEQLDSERNFDEYRHEMLQKRINEKVDAGLLPKSYSDEYRPVWYQNALQSLTGRRPTKYVRVNK